jgi:hypothetical protein
MASQVSQDEGPGGERRAGASRSEVYPPELKRKEAELLAGRGSVDGAKVGLAISGGGIRSATFGLGVIQALTREGLLPRIDYLSTVSGGGYIGSFLGSLYAGPRAPGAPAAPATATARSAEVVKALKDPHSFPLHWLRQSGRYMAPTGSGDNLIALAVFVRNWAAVQFVWASLATTALLATTWLSGGLRCFLDGGWARQQGIPGLSWSPLSLVPLLVLVLWSVPAGAAYWLNRWLQVGLVVLATVSLAIAMGSPPGRGRFVALTIAVVAVITVVTSWVYAIKYALPARRRYLTSGFKLSLLVLAGLAAVAFLDGAGSRLFVVVKENRLEWQALLAATGLGVPFAIAQRFAPWLFDNLGDGKSRFHIPISALAGAAAILVVGLVLTGLTATTYAIGMRSPSAGPGCCAYPAAAPGAGGLGVEAVARPLNGCTDLDRGALALAFSAGLFICFLVSHALGFLNLSSHHTLYSARLTRAYLGASNPERERLAKPLVDPIDGDDIPMASYSPHAFGGPLHLINVTVNETFGGETQVEQRDRKGMNLAVGPAGLSVGARHHAVWTDDTRTQVRGVAPPEGYRIFPGEGIVPEDLTLGKWVAVSGAAFTTGLGSRTNLGLSILCGLANIRLGHWWDSGCDPAKRVRIPDQTGEQKFWRWLSTVFPTQFGLLDELLARFYGPAQQLWYLTDGGHFENTAVYELIRRRVPFIVCCDSGADPDYGWEDVGHLVRKARTDFDAEIRFLSDAELRVRVHDSVLACFSAPYGFSPFLRRSPGEAEIPRPTAALAEVRWRDPDETGTILFIKPGLRGDEPADVLTYWAANPDFPHQTTFDQSFDEAQWESYRKLGEHTASLLFRPAAPAGEGTRWLPRALEPFHLG